MSTSPKSIAAAAAATPQHTNAAHHGPCAKCVEGDWAAGDMGFGTMAVHGGAAADAETGAVLCPIYQSVAFVQPSVEGYLSKGYSYSRQANPTVRSLEQRIATLEGGFDCVCVNSGMAATTTVFSALLKTGDHCILTASSYGGTNRCARVHFSKYGIEFSYVDMRDLDEVRAAIKPNTRVVFSETPTNPVLHMVDIAALSELLRKKQDNGGILHVCDSTFATPLICRPMQLGADVVCISTTKFYDGHNTSVGGAIVVKDKEMFERISLQRNILGNIMSPQVAFLQLCTAKTLHIRVEQQSRSALSIARMLREHPSVESVTYPGLDCYPQRELAKKQHLNDMHGGMLCFEVKGGTAAGVRLMNTVKRPWTLGENLGSTESIVTCPAVFTHANMLAEDRQKVGITDGMIRISVGVETTQDLIDSLKEALDQLAK